MSDHSMFVSGSSSSSSGWLCSLVTTPPFSIHSIVYEWLISHNFAFFSVCNGGKSKMLPEEINQTIVEKVSNPNYLMILFCMVLCLCIVSILEKIKSYLKSIPNLARVNVHDNQSTIINNPHPYNTIYQKIVNYSMVLIHERRIGLIITTIGLFVFAFFVLSHKTDEQLILLIKSNKIKQHSRVTTINQTSIIVTTENSTIFSSPSLFQYSNSSTNILLESLSSTSQPSRINSVNTNVQNTKPSKIEKYQQTYTSQIKSTWIEMQLQSRLKVGTVTMTETKQDTFLESAFKAILNIALLALKFFYIYLAMIGLVLLLRWLTLGSLSGMSTTTPHPIGVTLPVPTIPNASLLQMNFASP